MKDSNMESQQRLQHIEQAIADIEKFVKGESLKTFCEKDMLHNAVMMQFIIIGEAIIHVENEKLDKYDYPWYKVKCQCTTHPPRLTNIYEHFVENLLNKSLLNKAIVFKFDKICQNR